MGDRVFDKVFKQTSIQTAVLCFCDGSWVNAFLNLLLFDLLCSSWVCSVTAYFSRTTIQSDTEFGMYMVVFKKGGVSLNLTESLTHNFVRIWLNN